MSRLHPANHVCEMLSENKLYQSTKNWNMNIKEIMLRWHIDEYACTLHHQCVAQIWRTKVVWYYGETDLITVDNENEVKVRWYVSGRHIHVHVPSTIKVWTKYGNTRLYGNGKTNLIMKTSRKFNKASRPWKWSQGQVTHVWLTCILHDQCVDQIWWAKVVC